MKKSTSPCKRLPFTNPRRLVFPVVTTAILISGGAFFGCQLSQAPEGHLAETPPDASTLDPGARIAAALAALDSNVIKIRAHAQGQPSTLPSAQVSPPLIELGDIAASNCQAAAAFDPTAPSGLTVVPPHPHTKIPAINATETLLAEPSDTLRGATHGGFKGLVRMKLKLTSPFGDTAIKLTSLPEGHGDQMEASVDGQIVRFGVDLQRLISLHTQACETLKKSGDAELIADATTVTSMRDWLQRVAPDCEQFTPSAEGWVCKLPKSDPSAAIQELSGIRTTMIRRWSRQPYLLARRLAMGLSLAKALESNQPEKELGTFCNILKSSLPVELPATFTSRRWQRSVCTETNPNRTAAASFGLTKTVAEIDFLRQLFERTSRLGSLAVRLQTPNAPNQVWISLTPGPDVAENLARETAKLWATDASTEASTVTIDDLPRACWHPVYGEDPTLMHLARNLTLAGDAGTVECEEPEGPSMVKQQQAALERYFAESITSETEFILPNGRAKMLRLPAGTYHYVLRSLPENPNEWDEAVTSEISKSAPTASKTAAMSSKTSSTADDTLYHETSNAETRGHIVWDQKRPRPVITAW